MSSSRTRPASPLKIAGRSRCIFCRSRLSPSRKANSSQTVSALDDGSRPLMMIFGRGHSSRLAVVAIIGEPAAACRCFRVAAELRERVLARARSDKSLARFDRIALVLSGGGALGAYQAGVYAARENRGVRPNWIAGTAIGAINGAIIAGNLPHERVLRLRQFWQELSRRAAARTGHGVGGALRRLLASCAARWRGETLDRGREDAVVQTGELRELIQRAVDFERVNSGAVRLVLGAVNLITGAETYFDNDRHVIGLDHVLASTAFPGLPPVVIDRQRYGGRAGSGAALDDARPADTLWFVIDGYDPVPRGRGGIHRAARE